VKLNYTERNYWFLGYRLSLLALIAAFCVLR